MNPWLGTGFDVFALSPLWLASGTPKREADYSPNCVSSTPPCGVLLGKRNSDCLLEFEFQQRFAWNAVLIAVCCQLHACARSRSNARTDCCAFTTSRDTANYGAQGCSSADALATLLTASFPSDIVIGRIYWNDVAMDSDTSKIQRQIRCAGNLSCFFSLCELALNIGALRRDCLVADGKRTLQARMKAIADFVLG